MIIEPITFTPRAYGPLIFDLVQNNKRCAQWVGMGLGKTGHTLVALEALSLTDRVWPALVIAPKRVANSVWDAEVAKWAQIAHLRVSKVIGTPEQRMAALAQPAEIYTVNYENLQWLFNYLQGKRWMFTTCIADEASRLKGLRAFYNQNNTFVCGGGTKNAAALARCASRFTRFIELTGSPGSNGLADLWGQVWFLDAGARLGKNFTAYEGRWFRSISVGTHAAAKTLKPRENAQEEIMERVKDICLSIDTYDWLPIDKPNFVDVNIHLTPALRKQYDMLMTEFVTELDNGVVINAVNAGAKTQKLLQFASGSVLDSNEDAGARVVHHVHDLKLEALESVYSELAGESLIVVYHYRADRERILKKFKFAVELPTDSAKQLKVEARWNAGKIPMLLVHAQSAGHGLNLQYGGRNMCIYSLQWNLEHNEQVIERIGPARQWQAGFKRIVNVFRLIAKDTIDETVAKRLITKVSIQDAIKGAVKRWKTERAK